MYPANCAGRIQQLCHSRIVYRKMLLLKNGLMNEEGEKCNVLSNSCQGSNQGDFYNMLAVFLIGSSVFEHHRDKLPPVNMNRNFALSKGFLYEKINLKKNFYLILLAVVCPSIINFFLLTLTRGSLGYQNFVETQFLNAAELNFQQYK